MSQPRGAQDTCRTQHAIFADGWRDGFLGIALETTRAVEMRYPAYGHLETILYLNGAEDGAKADRFRLDMECSFCGKEA